MARKHPETVLAALETLATANPKATARELRTMIEQGRFPGLAPYDGLGLRIVQYHAKRARRDLEPTPDDLDAGTDALERRMFAMIRRDVRRLEAKSALTVDDSRLLREHQRTLRGMVDHRRRRADPQKQEAKRGQDARPASALARIASVIADEDADADGDRAPPLAT